MKKLIALVLTIACVFALTACGNSNPPADGGTSTGGNAATYASAEEVLTKIWDAYTENEKFPCWGGNAESMVDGAPAAFDVSNTDELTGTLLAPAMLVVDIDDAANLMHGMNLNTFTGAVFHVADVDTFVGAYTEKLASNQWMCGIPEQFVIIDAGNGYLVTAFGAADLIDIFEGHALEVLEGSSVIKSGPVVE